MYALLVVEVNNNKQSVKVTLTQGGLTKKFLKIVGMLYSNNNTTPAETIPFLTYSDVPPFNEIW